MSERCTKHTKYERFIKHSLQINREEENVLNLYVLFSFIYLYCYYCYFSYYCYDYYHIVILLLVIIIVIIIIGFYVVTICFIFDGARLWPGAWQISRNVKNKRNGGYHEADENDDNTFIYIYIYIYIYICISLLLLLLLLLLLFICYFF